MSDRRAGDRQAQEQLRRQEEARAAAGEAPSATAPPTSGQQHRTALQPTHLNASTRTAPVLLAGLARVAPHDRLIEHLSDSICSGPAIGGSSGRRAARPRREAEASLREQARALPETLQRSC